MIDGDEIEYGYDDVDKVEDEYPEELRSDIESDDESERKPFVTNKPDMIYPVNRVESSRFILKGRQTKACPLEFITRPWLNGKTMTYISNPYQISENDISKYIISTDSIVKNGITWFRANKLFTLLQCNIYSHSRRQIGNILVCLDEHGVELYFEVGYKYPTKFVIQDEKIFAAEMEYIYGSSLRNISYFLGKKLEDNEKIRKTIIMVFLRALSDSGIADGVVISEFAEKLEHKAFELASGKSTRDYLKYIVSVLLYLNINDAKVSGKQTKFQHDIDTGVYDEESIYGLSPEKKIPEMYINASTDDDKKNLDTMFEEIENELITTIASESVLATHYSTRVPTLQRSQIMLKLANNLLSLPYVVKSCVNKDVVSGREWEIVYYKDENEETYCFNIYALVDNFLRGDFVNQHTGNVFRKEFINKILKISGSSVKPQISTIENVSNVNSLQMQMYDVLFNELDILEENIIRAKADRKLKCQYCQKYVQEQQMISSVKRRKSGPKIVQYCSSECFQEDAHFKKSDL